MNLKQSPMKNEEKFNEIKKIAGYTYDLYDIAYFAYEATLRPVRNMDTDKLISMGAEIVGLLYDGDLDAAYAEVVTPQPMSLEVKHKLNTFLNNY